MRLQSRGCPKSELDAKGLGWSNINIWIGWGDGHRNSSCVALLCHLVLPSSDRRAPDALALEVGVCEKGGGRGSVWTESIPIAG
jgi:hypothetical protein